MSLKTIDVAIGIIFLYLLLTFLASAIVELISRILNWRARNLYDAIENMFANSKLLCADDVYKNPLVIALSRNASTIPRLDFLERMGWRKRPDHTPPAYIPSTTFSAVVLERLINGPAKAPAALSPDGAIAAVRDRAEAAQGGGGDALLSLLKTTLATQGDSIQAVRLAIERWFNDTMDRASGWYKRRTQSVLLLLGLMIAYAGNVETIGVVQWLWRSDTARQAVVAAATDYVKANPAPVPAPGSSDPTALQLNDLATRVANADKKIADLQYPIGWYVERKQPGWLLQYLVGGLITAIAISMGSTFWFDALKSLVNIRSTGPKPAAR
jgi:hypothetical protein